MDRKTHIKTKYPNIYKNIKNGNYDNDISLGYDANTGKRIRTTKTGIKTLKEAQKILNNSKSKDELKQELINKERFEDYLEDYYNWCLDFEKMKPYTVKQKKGKFEAHMLPVFKGKKINKIKGSDIYKWQQSLPVELSIVTKNTLHKQLSAYFNWLVNVKELISVNPCRAVKNFKIPKTDITYYTLDEFNRLCEEVEKDLPKRNAYLILAILKMFFFTGLRVGELFGLKFSDFDYDLINNKDIDVEVVEIKLHHPVYYTKGGWIETNGKTDASIDNLFVGKKMLSYLMNYLNYMKEHGVVYNKDEHIFLNPDRGTIFSQEYIRHLINAYMGRANLKHIDLKSLRHSCGTFLLSSGYSLEEVQKKLRHSSKYTTETYYATFYNENKKRMASDIDKFA